MGFQKTCLFKQCRTEVFIPILVFKLPYSMLMQLKDNTLQEDEKVNVRVMVTE